MAADAFKVAVVGRALLLAVGLADRAIQVEDQLFQRPSSLDLVDPLAGEIHQRREIACGAERLRFKPAHFAGRSGLLLRLAGSASHDVTHRGIDAPPLGIR